jgi:hypothetical protein
VHVCILAALCCTLPGYGICALNPNARDTDHRLEMFDSEVRRAFHEMSTLTKNIIVAGEINGFALHLHETINLYYNLELF